MGLIDRWRARRRGGVVKGSYVTDIEWHRVEELRPERLGPSEDDVQSEGIERPSKTLGPMRYR